MLVQRKVLGTIGRSGLEIAVLLHSLSKCRGNSRRGICGGFIRQRAHFIARTNQHGLQLEAGIWRTTNRIGEVTLEDGAVSSCTGFQRQVTADVCTGNSQYIARLENVFLFIVKRGARITAVTYRGTIMDNRTLGLSRLARSYIIFATRSIQQQRDDCK